MGSIALTVPNFMLAMAVIAETDLISAVAAEVRRHARPTLRRGGAASAAAARPFPASRHSAEGRDD
jgi:hypothetical protein